MASLNWRVWLIPFGLWGLYLCWYSGYQSGYAEGHATAWDVLSPMCFAAAIPAKHGEFREAQADPLTDAVVR